MLFVIVSLLCASAVTSNNVEQRFLQWVDDFRVNFESGMHREHVFANWVANDEYIQQVNNRNLSYVLGHNHLSGMNQEEYSGYLGFRQEDVGKFDPSKTRGKVEEVKCLYDCVKDYDASNKLATMQCVKGCLDHND